MYEDKTVMKEPEMCFVAKECCLVANFVFQQVNDQYFLSE